MFDLDNSSPLILAKQLFILKGDSSTIFFGNVNGIRVLYSSYSTVSVKLGGKIGESP